MPQTRNNKVIVPTNSDAYNLTGDLATMADSITSVVKVASQAERDALPGAIKTNGLVVARTDMPGVAEIFDGTNWWKLGGPQHAEYTGSTSPTANSLWGPGPLVIDSASTINGFTSSPSNDRLALGIGVYDVQIRYILSANASGTSWGAIVNDGNTVTFASTDLQPGNSTVTVFAKGINLTSAQNIRFTFITGTGGATLTSRIRIDRMA